MTRTDVRLYVLARRKRAQDERRWFKRQLVEAAFSGLLIPSPVRGSGWWWGPSFDLAIAYELMY